MEQSRVLVALALVLYVLSLVERTPAFVPATAEQRSSPSALRGSGFAAERPGVAPAAGSAPVLPAWGLRGASALLALGAVAVAARESRGRQSSGRAARIVRQADRSQLTPSGPIVVYTEALQQAAASKEESVPVTKDVMKLKKMMEEDETFRELLLERNTPGFSQVDEAKLIVELIKDWESTVMPKFVMYLAKKKRIVSLPRILQQYVQTLYISQSIEPVRVTAASPLTDAQKTKIKDKMKEKLGVDDIKLICDFDTGLLGGFKVEYGFTDPDNLKVPSMETDISLKSYLNNAAIKEGVVV